ncbi:MAG TPA: 5-formyltetrahydrofolate cyclo-ligase [Oxalicibacterium sp.]|jgi:5,10-methenyltetrahydrofolate synthetase|nr:5-formyltetrahydrofolate cyclo-ligase [Oxalicibacterium sp.]
MQNKTDIRRELLEARNALTADRRASFDSTIAAKILDWWRESSIVRLGVYWPMRGEPDLHPLYAELAVRGVELSLPLATANEPLRFAPWRPGEIIVRDRYGAGVPAVTRDIVQPEALLIPCVGFDTARFRLGYGGGFYDRTLAQMPRPYTIGVAYALCKTRFAVDEYDVPLDRIITDKTVLA